MNVDELNGEALTGGLIGTSISAGGLLISTTELAMWISIVCTVLGLILTIVTTLIIPLAQGKKLSKEDIEEVTKRIDETADKMDGISRGGKDHE